MELTDTQIARAHELFDGGMDLEAVSRELGVDKKYVGQHLLYKMIRRAMNRPTPPRVYKKPGRGGSIPRT